MDINYYIGKFLQKNKYCSLPGLGVFDLKKNGAAINISQHTISSANTSITFTPVGTIDDTFASFIATLENVSISNASNAIRQYCIDVKAELAKTGKYEVEHIGRFTLANQKIVFHQSEDFNLGLEPAPLAPLEEKPKPVAPVAETNTSPKTDYSYPSSLNKKKKNLGLKVALPLLAVVVLGVAGYFGYSYFKNQQNTTSQAPIETAITQVDTIPKPQDTLAKNNFDTLSTHTATTHDTTNPEIVDTLSTPSNPVTTAPIGKAYNVAVLSYDNEVSATLKAKKLKDYGNASSVVNNNGKFLVVINATQTMNDTTRLVDSLRRLYNPKGPVFILK